MVSPYEVLQVDPDASEEEIEAAYRRRVKETHPDQGGSASEFRLVRLAYEELQVERGREERPQPRQRRSARRRRRDAEPSGRRDRWRDERRDRGGQPQHGPQSGGRTRRQPESSVVEYLDYEVLADRGWSLDDDDLFEKAAAANLSPDEHGQLEVEDGEYLLEAAEDAGFAWPFSCRGGACANCAVAACEGDLEMAVDTVLTDDLLDRNIRLSCIGTPTSESAKVVFNVKQLPDLEELRLPPRPFGGAAGDE